MTNTVNQPSAWPTNKLAVAATIGPAATEAYAAIMSAFVPEIAGPEVSLFVGMGVSFGVGYFVKDRPNVVT